MPITARDLQPGDILFKHASSGAISQAIAKGQKAHHDALLTRTGPSPMGERLATDITHVALAIGPDDVMEFDEGSANKAALMFLSGRGCVRGGMALPSRSGKRYEVFSCGFDDLGRVAADKAELLWDVTRQSRGKVKASYGVRKVLGTAIRHKHGNALSLAYFEQELQRWMEVGSSTGWKSLFSSIDVQFFCSEFAAYCYLWAAAESGAGHVLGPDYLLGTAKARMAPVELYTRVETAGRRFFGFKGTLYTS